MSAINAAQIQAAQAGDNAAQTEVFEAIRPVLRSFAAEYATNPQELAELEGEAALSFMTHLGGYKVGARASLTTYLYPRVRQDVRNAHFANRSGGTMPGGVYAEYTRAAGKVHGEIREERGQGGDIVRDGEIHERMKSALMSLPGKHAWSEERFLSAHDVIHMGTQSMEEEDENGEEFGAALVDPYGHGDPAGLIPSDEEVRARGVRAQKRALAWEMLEDLTEKQMANLVLSFGIDQASGEYVIGSLEELVRKLDGITASGIKSPDANQGLTKTSVTNADIAEALGLTPKSVSTRRTEAVVKLRNLFADRDYPTHVALRQTPAEESVQGAVEAGDYVRAKFFDGPGERDVLLQAFNDEGDLAELYLPVHRAAELGLIEGETVEVSIPDAPEAYTYLRRFGDSQLPEDTQVFDAGHAILHGVSKTAGYHKKRDNEVTSTIGAPVGRAPGVDYSAPLWDVPAADRLHYMGRRSQR